MRFCLPAVLSLSLALSLGGAALAQTPSVTIEDDVSHGNAIACAGLRAAQEKKAPDALVSAAHAAWIKSLKAAGHDPAITAKEVADEAARLASASPADLKAKSAQCEPFEIR